MDPKALALQNKAALEAAGYTVDAQGNVTQQYDLPGPHGVSPGKGTTYVSPNEWIYKIPGVYAPGAPGSDPVSGTTPYGTSLIGSLPSEQTGIGNVFESTDWNGETGQYETSPNWLEDTVLAGVGGLGAGATLGALYGATAAAPGAAGSGGDAAALAAEEAAGSSAASGVGAGTSAAAGTVAKAAGAVAKSASSPSILSSIIGLAGQGISSYLGAKASTTAADQMANASMYAADLNAKATANSLAFQQQQWAQAQQNAAPFIKLGQQGATSLGNILGFNGPVNPATAAPFTQGIPANVGSAALSNIPQQRGTAQPSLSSLYSTPGATPMGVQPAPTNTSSYVKISWNDGSVDSVPASTVPQYQTLGAKVVS